MFRNVNNNYKGTNSNTPDEEYCQNGNECQIRFICYKKHPDDIPKQNQANVLSRPQLDQQQMIVNREKQEKKPQNVHAKNQGGQGQKKQNYKLQHRKDRQEHTNAINLGNDCDSVNPSSYFQNPERQHKIEDNNFPINIRRGNYNANQNQGTSAFNPNSKNQMNNNKNKVRNLSDSNKKQGNQGQKRQSIKQQPENNEENSKTICQQGDLCNNTQCSLFHPKEGFNFRQIYNPNNQPNIKTENNTGISPSNHTPIKQKQHHRGKSDIFSQENKQKNDFSVFSEFSNQDCLNQPNDNIKVNSEKKINSDLRSFFDDIRMQDKQKQMVKQPEIAAIKAQKEIKEKKNPLSKQQEPPKPIYYLDQNQINNEVLPHQKCHWFDLFGKCDENRCTYNHNFEPLFYCKNIKGGKNCTISLPGYIQKHFAKKKNAGYNCNNPENRIRNVCHDYCLEGVCSTIICQNIHKTVEKKCPNEINCPLCQKRRDEIKLKILSVGKHLTEQFQYNGKKFQKKLGTIYNKIPLLREEIKNRETLDLIFIVDCTQSMQIWIDFVRESIDSIIATFKAAYKTFTYRFSFVGYRDFNDEQVENFDFSDDLAQFKEHVKKIKGVGGDDIAEDMISGLQHGLNQNFRSTIKVAFLFYDAPSHGKNYHDGDITDNFKEINDKIEDYIQKFAERDIYLAQIMLKKPQHKKFYAQKTFDAIRNEYIKNGKEQYIYEFLTSENPSEQIEQFICQVLETSVKHTLSRIGNIKKTPSGMIENPIFKKLNFNQEIKFNFLNYFIRQLDFPTQWNNPYIIEEASSYDYKIQIYEQSRKGSSRIAFNGQDLTSKKKIVVKFDQLVTESPDQNLQIMQAQIQSQVVSSHLVEIFRKLVLPYVSSLESLPYYIGSKIAKFEDNYCYVETFLEGFDKFSNNANFQKEAQNENQLLLECLPHFSFQYTQGYLMLCDLQGSGPILTDPCIHTFKNDGYGLTNLGLQGMAMYFMKHQCNEFCYKLNLVSPDNFQNLGDNYDYHQEITKQVKDELIFIKNQKEISKYKERPLFCQLCEDEEIKNTEKQQNLLEFVESICIECETSTKQKTSTHCTMCGGHFKFSEYELKRKRGTQNGRCQVCNQYFDLMNIFKYYDKQGGSNKFELSFKVLTKS